MKEHKRDQEKQEAHTHSNGQAPTRGIKSATSTRRSWSLISSLFLFFGLVFLVMVNIGGTSNRTVLKDIWFIRLNLTNVVPEAVPQAGVLNSIAQTLGLHDFYQVSLWNYCEGYNSQGVTECSDPETLYWFNPVDIIEGQLLRGSEIQLPDTLTKVLNLIKIASKVMFGFFLLGACLTFILILITPLSVISRWIAFFLMIFSFLNAAVVAIASAIGTAMFILMRNVFQNSITEVNIQATIGTTMFALMWTATFCVIVAWLIQTSLTCCCTSRRDVKSGRKRVT